MTGRNCIVKNAKIFAEHDAKNFELKFLTVTENSQENKMNSLSYDVNDPA